MPEKRLNVILLRATPDAQEACALAAKLCYAKADVETLKDKVESSEQESFIARLMSMGHYSALEHVSFTFAVEGVSRVLLAQLTRHRIASFSVQSQRYVSLAENFSYIIPPNIKALGEDAVAEYEREMAQMHAWYVNWQERLEKGAGGNEDARFVLPGACETRLVMTMNARELLHFFSLRCCNRAQWEIRALANEMLRLVKQAAPAIFANAGPSCVSGACPEGEKTCGKTKEMRAYYKTL